MKEKDFYDKIGELINDPNFAERYRNRDYGKFEQEHRAYAADPKIPSNLIIPTKRRS